MTRYQLAQLISPGKLSVDLEKPDLTKLPHLSVSRELPEIEQLYAIAEKNNPRLTSIQHKLESMRFKLNDRQHSRRLIR